MPVVRKRTVVIALTALLLWLALPAQSRQPQTTAPALGAQLGPQRVQAQASAWTPLFNGTNLDGWYTYLPSRGKNNDPEGVFKAEDGLLHILDVPDTGADREFGYLATNAEYSNYHLRYEYRWGDEKFPPRETVKRDSGLLYHVVGSDKVWPTSLESQVQEGDTGDYFILSGPSIQTEVRPGSSQYQPGGERITTSGRIVKRSTEDSLTEWNVAEAVVRGNASVHIVNGVVVNRGFNATLNGQPLTAGKIMFQAEGAEIFYRNIEIQPVSAPGQALNNVLVFSKTSGFRHASIPDAIAAIEQLGVLNGFSVTATEDAAFFADANLAQFDAVIFASTTGDVLNADQQAAFEQYIRSGGGYVGIHSASDTEYSWPWYGELMGAFFDSHPAIQTATINVEDRSHPSTAHLGSTWVRNDEWYNFQRNPRTAPSPVNVLATLDESTYDGGNMGDDHPIAWYHEFDGGRAWYTGGGHTKESYSEPDFIQHLLGGIQYAAGASEPSPNPTATPAGPTPINTPAGPTPTNTPAAPTPGGALDRSGWSATASTNGGQTGKAFDGNASSRWSTGQFQAPGQFFQLDLGAAQSFARLELTLVDEIFDYPRGYEVYASDDPNNFGAAIATGSGDDPVDGNTRTTTISFAVQTARYVRIVQTSSDDERYWSIYELNLYAPAGPPVDNGLRYDYFEGTFNQLPDFDALSALSSGEVESFSLAPRSGNDNFAFRFSGCLNVETAGAYTFFTTSDDGSQLLIDGALVVNNDGLHSARERSGPITLAAGSHPIEVTFFEKTGKELLAVAYSGPGMSKQAVPSSALSPDGCAPSTQSAGVSGLIFIDENGNGEQDEDEPGLAGVGVTLREINSGVQQRTTTDGDGFYYFAQIAEQGIYLLSLALPAGYSAVDAAQLQIAPGAGNTNAPSLAVVDDDEPGGTIPNAGGDNGIWLPLVNR